MDDDQQFCLRWNNHQSTLVAVFDTLLENGTLVDCTLAAEGKCLNAHKVVLSACSPYFESLLSRHFDKHPILILKDVKFQELKAMMDYMYRGEVNISQDQLGALLKAAESLQIKGLSDNRKGETERKPAPAPPPPKSPQPTSALPKVQGLTIEQRSRDDSREGSMSPGPRKKKRLRRKSEELDNHDASNSSESHSLPAQNIPSSLPAVSKINADVPEPVETKSEILTRHKQSDDIPQVPIIKEKIETHTELMLEPKSEYVEEMNEDSIEDLTLDDDDLSNMEQMDDQAGPSHGNAGEGSSQGFGGWHMGNQSQDEVFLAAQEAVGAHRDSQGEKKNVGETIEESGKSIEEGGKSVEESGKGVEESGSSVKKSGKSVEESGKNVKEGEKGIEGSGKNVKEGGKSIKKSANSVEGSGKSVEESGKSVEESRKNVEESGKRAEESGKSVEESGSSISISRGKEKPKSADKAPIKIHSNLSIKRKAQEIPKENKKQFAEGSSNKTDENTSKPEIEIIDLSAEDMQEQNPQKVVPEAVVVRPKQAEEVETDGKTAETSNQEMEYSTRRRICQQCGRDFAGKKELKYHVQIVCGKEPQLKCPLCFEKFYKKFVLVGHLRHNHGISTAAAKKMFPKNVLKRMQLI